MPSRSAAVIIGLWAAGGALVLTRTLVAAVSLLNLSPPARFAEGPLLASFIFGCVALLALSEASLRYRGILRAVQFRRLLAWPLSALAGLWLLMGGWYYETWYGALGVSLIFIAASICAVWQAAWSDQSSSTKVV